jgi:hypothetical protein
MTAAGTRDLLSWQAEQTHTVAGARARGADLVVAGRGPGVTVHDALVDEVAVTRALAGFEHNDRFGWSQLTIAERREVVRRLRARRWTAQRIGAWIHTTASTVRAYEHWMATGEWVAPQRIDAVLRARHLPVS